MQMSTNPTAERPCQASVVRNWVHDRLPWPPESLSRLRLRLSSRRAGRSESVYRERRGDKDRSSFEYERLRDGLLSGGALRRWPRSSLPSRSLSSDFSRASTPFKPSDLAACRFDFFSFLRSFRARFSSGVSSLCLPFDFDFFAFLLACSSRHFSSR
ncbi:hypothetical protein BC834DRAFT_678569 [Gloeopeniophorella convolvens]|nr:hypothetical protein BC834DRAFT_678569 [Gloeopeniophorella convolvens]